MSTLSKRFVVVSNRLPISIDRDESGQLIASQGAGGLVTALAPVLKNRGGTWIGWPGISHPDTNNMCLNFSKKAGYDLEPVHLTDAEIDGFYLGFSNEILWPLFHEFQMPCNFNPTYWDDYYSANKKFADVILNKTSSDDFIWVHDYHLILLAKILKAANPKLRVGFFYISRSHPLIFFLKYHGEKNSSTRLWILISLVFKLHVTGETSLKFQNVYIATEFKKGADNSYTSKQEIEI